MGSLAFWAGVGGAGKGWEKGILAKEERDAAKIDNDRKVALERMRQEGENTRADKRESGADRRLVVSNQAAEDRIGLETAATLEVEGQRFENNRTVADDNAFNAEQLQVMKQNWESIEKELDRVHKGELNAASARASNNPFLNDYASRFTMRTDTEKEFENGGLEVSHRNVPIVGDVMTGKTYAQQSHPATGSIFVPANSPMPEFDKLLSETKADGTPKYRLPNQQAVDQLLMNPTPSEEQSFLKTFKFLPPNFLAARMTYDLNKVIGGGGVMGGQPAPQNPATVDPSVPLGTMSVDPQGATNRQNPGDDTNYLLPGGNP